LKLPYEIKRLGSWRCIELFFKKYSYFDLTQMARQWPVCMEKNYMSHEKQFTSHAFLDIKSTFFFYIDQTANPLSPPLLFFTSLPSHVMHTPRCILFNFQSHTQTFQVNIFFQSHDFFFMKILFYTNVISSVINQYLYQYHM